MSKYTSKSDNSLISELNLKTDVLVIGGGISATWAAWNASVQGVIVVLVDKSYYGTGGATVPKGTAIQNV